jgi:hypothetical protein
MSQNAKTRVSLLWHVPSPAARQKKLISLGRNSGASFEINQDWKSAIAHHSTVMRPELFAALSERFRIGMEALHLPLLGVVPKGNTERPWE